MTEPLIKTYAILLGEKDQSLIDLVEQVRGVDSVYDGTVFQSFMMQGIKLLLDYANAKNVKLYQAYLDLTFNPEQFLATLEDVDTHASLVSSYEQYSTVLQMKNLHKPLIYQIFQVLECDLKV